MKNRSVKGDIIVSPDFTSGGSRNPALTSGRRRRNPPSALAAMLGAVGLGTSSGKLNRRRGTPNLKTVGGSVAGRTLNPLPLKARRGGTAWKCIKDGRNWKCGQCWVGPLDSGGGAFAYCVFLTVPIDPTKPSTSPSIDDIAAHLRGVGDEGPWKCVKVGRDWECTQCTTYSHGEGGFAVFCDILTVPIDPTKPSTPPSAADIAARLRRGRAARDAGRLTLANPQRNLLPDFPGFDLPDFGGFHLPAMPAPAMPAPAAPAPAAPVPVQQPFFVWQHPWQQQYQQQQAQQRRDQKPPQCVPGYDPVRSVDDYGRTEWTCTGPFDAQGNQRSYIWDPEDLRWLPMAQKNTGGGSNAVDALMGMQYDPGGSAQPRQARAFR